MRFAQADRGPLNSDSCFFVDLALTTGGIVTLKQERKATVMEVHYCHCNITWNKTLKSSYRINMQAFLTKLCFMWFVKLVI